MIDSLISKNPIDVVPFNWHENLKESVYRFVAISLHLGIYTPMAFSMHTCVLLSHVQLCNPIAHQALLQARILEWVAIPFSLVAQMVKHLAAMRETPVRSLGQEDPLEKEMATLSSTLAWKIPWTEEPGRLQSMGSQRVRHNWTTSLSFFFSKTKWHQFSSVAQSCPTLCDPMNCSSPGLPVHHQRPESTHTHVHWVGDAIQPSHPLLSPSPPALNLSQHQGLFKSVSSLHQVAKVLEFQLQHQSFQWTPRDWSPLGWTGWISLQSKGLSRVFSNTIVQKHQFLGAQLHSPTLTSIHDYWKNQSLD